MRARPAGPDAVLVEVADAEAALGLATWARESGVRADEVVPAATTVLFDGVADPAALLEHLAGWTPGPAVRHGEVVEIVVRYDGADLDRVAGLWGTSRDEVVARHTGLELVSAFCGFAPGFAYLSGMPAELAVPRLDSPRARVPAGAVAVADLWCGVYPTASPGGWSILGHTDAVLWDPDRSPPALLAPGTRVRFVAA